MVVRFVWAWSIWAQKPKSADVSVSLRSICVELLTRTQLDVALHGEKNVVGLDITMYDALGMQMLQPLQCLSMRQSSHPLTRIAIHTSRHTAAI